MKANVSVLAALCLVFVWSACSSEPEPAPTFTLGGVVAGLHGTGLTLSSEGGEVVVAGDGAFVFPKALPSASSYEVVVAVHPVEPFQQCDVMGGTGVMESANVDSVEVACVDVHSVGGSVSGLAGTGLQLRSEAGTVSPSGDGAFVFPNLVPVASDYTVAVEIQPTAPAQRCSVVGATGTVSGDVTNVEVTCRTVYKLGGAVGGLISGGLVLASATGESITVDTEGGFVFGEDYFEGDSYAVTIETVAPGHVCAVSAESGIFTAADVDTVAVTCVPVPAAPTGLVATGALGEIVLDWDDAPETFVDGFDVYRSSDGTIFTKLNTTPLTLSSHTNTMTSPDDDGVYYFYHVVALNDAGGTESLPSASVKEVHGTRLAATYAAGHNTTASLSPYVLEGSSNVEAGIFNVVTGTALYVEESATLQIGAGAQFNVTGLLRTLATSGDGVITLAGYNPTGETLQNGTGFSMLFNSCVDYGTGEGTLVQYVHATGIARRNGDSFGVKVTGCAPKFYNSKFVGNEPSTPVTFNLASAAIVDKCELDGFQAKVEDASFSSWQGSVFSLTRSIIRAPSTSYRFDIGLIPTPCFDPGMISYNAIYGSNEINLFANSGTATIPMENNFWDNAVTIRHQGTDASVAIDTDPSLAAPPADVGADW